VRAGFGHAPVAQSIESFIAITLGASKQARASETPNHNSISINFQESKMSRKSRSRNSFRQAAIKAGGAHRTREGRVETLVRFHDILWNANFQVPDIMSVGVRHVRFYMDQRKNAGVEPPSQRNELSHLRGALRAAGRPGLATDPLISNKSFGLSGAARKGTNRPPTAEAEHRILQTAALKLKPHEHASVLLQQSLGLRAQEAICFGPTLAEAERALLNGDKVPVYRGTKSGRPRLVRPYDYELALIAVRAGLKVLAETGHLDLFPQSDLEKAHKRYMNVWSWHLTKAAGDGSTSHSLRYGFGVRRLLQCIEQGKSKRDLLIEVAADFGHGDGRGRFMRSIYGQTVEQLQGRLPRL
jgi:hypothetical protein